MSHRDPRPKHSHFRRDGQPKQEFTETEAKAKARELDGYDLDNGRLLTRPVAYLCADGAHWHVGNANPRGPWTAPDFTPEAYLEVCEP